MKRSGMMLIILGLILVCVAGYQFYQSYHFDETAIKTLGTITSIQVVHQTGRYAQVIDVPTIMFALNNGQKSSFVYTSGLSLGSVNVGDTFPVIYQENNTSDATLDFQWMKWIIFSIEIIAAVFAFLMSIVLFRYKPIN